MIKNVLQYLEETEQKFPEKIAFADANKESKYKEFCLSVRKIGTHIIKKVNKVNIPIVIFIDKSVECLEVAFGIIYSGNFYTIIDINSPPERITSILNTLDNKVIVTNQKNLKKATQIGLINEFTSYFLYENLINTNVDSVQLEMIRTNVIDTDPAYIIFTSGSTGIPKGTVVSHKAVISYINWVKDTFNINEATVFGNQTPFYFSMSILDVYTTICTGATFYIIPKMYFSFPIKLIEYLKEKKINTIYWVPSALSIVANLEALENVELPDLNKILFAGEVMPVRPLNYWINHVPNAIYANLYGPTEVTDICTYYIVDRKFENHESLPIGKPCNNCDVIIIKKDGTQAIDTEEGELYVRGSFLASGYYNYPEKTNQAFVQNPLNKNYPEIVYKTGDIVRKNARGELIYLSRKDFQIKHMGYRIELGEIETVVNSLNEIISCACLYNSICDNIVLFYQSNEIDDVELLKKLRTKLLPYMQPNKIKKLGKMPYNSNGKIDRVYLKKLL